MVSCYLCGRVLNEGNDSWEHVIPNAIGGRLRVRDLICKACNSGLGLTIDNELTQQLSVYCTLLNIKRQKGKPRPVKGVGIKTNKPWTILPGGRPQISAPEIVIDKTADRIDVRIVARSESEFRKILSGIKRKHGPTHTERILREPRWSQEWVNEPVRFNTGIGGELAFRSVCKTVVNLYLKEAGDLGSAAKAVNYIKNGGTEDVAMHYYPKKPIIELTDPVGIGHSVFVVGSNEERLAYGCVEYFDTFRILIIIDEDYAGASFQEYYSVDVLSGKERTVKEISNLRREELEELRREPKMPMERCLTAVLQLLYEIKDKQVSEYIDEAISTILDEYAEGEPITEDMLNDIVRRVMIRLEPLIKQRYFTDGTEE